MRKFIIITLAFFYNISFIVLLKGIQTYFEVLTFQQYMLFLYIAFALTMTIYPLSILTNRIADKITDKIKKEDIK